MTFTGEGYSPSSGISRLLFSQVGYEPGLPVRIIIRLPEKHFMSDLATYRLTRENSREEMETPCSYWGEVWQYHWWIAEFPAGIREGEWSIGILDGGRLVFADEGLLIRKNILWDETIEYTAVDMLERRVHFSKFGALWQDVGTLWIESCAQSGMVMGPEDLLEKSTGRLSSSLIGRIQDQIMVGCNYLVLTQEKAQGNCI